MIADTEHVVIAIITLIGTIITGLIATVNVLVSKIVKSNQDTHSAELETVTDRIAGVERKIDDHVTWEMQHPATARKGRTPT